MFNDSIFENWLDGKTTELIDKLGRGGSLSSEEMMILVLKAQTNHFAHLDQDLRSEIKALNVKVDEKFEVMDKLFDRYYNFAKWQLGIISGALIAIFIKLFVG